MTLKNISFAIQGDTFHTPCCGYFEHQQDVLILIDENGEIIDILRPDMEERGSLIDQLKNQNKLICLDEQQYLLPDLVDLHIHAPQWSQMGKALDAPLSDWLQNYTFPLEEKYKDTEFASRMYNSLVDNLLANGTTTALYFGSIHLAATKILADICHLKGQRSFIGKVVMDNPAECPDFYQDASTSVGLQDSVSFIEYVKNMKGNESQLVNPVVTPRFLPSCSDKMLQGLGQIVGKYDCHVQSHCCESDWVQGYGMERFGQSDVKTFRDFGLLTNKSILAHANFMSDEDFAIMQEYQASVAHCPLSNSYFSNAVFPARQALDKGINTGLGTDIGAGSNPSILNSCINAVTVSRMREDGVHAHLPASKRGHENSRINFMEAFWMATLGGSKALDIRAGLFKKGYLFDAILIDAGKPDSNLILWPELDSFKDVFQKIIYNADRHAIQKVWVNGTLVKSIN